MGLMGVAIANQFCQGSYNLWEKEMNEVCLKSGFYVRSCQSTIFLNKLSINSKNYSKGGEEKPWTNKTVFSWNKFKNELNWQIENPQILFNWLKLSSIIWTNH